MDSRLRGNDGVGAWLGLGAGCLMHGLWWRGVVGRIKKHPGNLVTAGVGWAVEGASLGEGAMLMPVPPEQGQFAGPE